MKESAKISALKQLIKEGYNEDEAMAIVNSAFNDEEDRAQGESGKIAYSREIVRNAQLEARSALLPWVQVQLQGKKDDFFSEMNNTIVQLKMMEMVLGRGEEEREMSKLMERLANKIEDMRIKALEAEIQHRDKEVEELKEQFKSFKEEIKDLMQRIPQRNSTPREKEDITTRITKDFQKLQEWKELLKELGMVEDRNTMDEEEIIEQLRREGYRIKGPPTLEEVQRMVDEEVKKREQEIRQEVEEQKIKKERTRMAMNFILDLMDGVMGVVSASKEKHTGEDFATLLKNVVSNTNGGGDQEGVNEQAGA